MRLHPVIPMVVRTLMRPADDRRLATSRAGTTVGPVDPHRAPREDNHPDPAAFRPERFLGQNPPPNTWIPFGGGVRRCIGAGFALMEGVAVLREVFAAVRRHRRRRRTSPGSATSPASRATARGSG